MSRKKRKQEMPRPRRKSKYLNNIQCGSLKKGERVWGQPLSPPMLNVVDRPVLTLEGRDLARITRK